ncbi:DUF6538 domain-containing protein [Aquibium oceanicum]|uniref:DUF6538 domain-containing protein n=1 Tax=Aquibium oceanicum TaxID=1670800 RepID=UPI000B2A3FB8
MRFKDAYLQRRGEVWQFRIRVPTDLVPSVGRREIKKSLRTGDRSQARELARIELVKLDGEWSRLRRSLKPVATPNLTEAEVFHLAATWFVSAEKRNAATAGSLSREQAEIELADMNADENLGTALHEAYEAVTNAAGIRPPEGSPAQQRLLGVLRRAIVESNNRRIARHGVGSTYRDPLFQDLSEATSLKPVATKTLKKVMEMITSDATRQELRGKSLLKRDAHWRVVKEFFGAETPLSQIRREDVRAFMDLLKRLPSNASKHYPGKTLQQAADLAERAGLPRMSSDTANGYLRSLGAIFRFAVDEGYVEADPSAGILLPKAPGRAKDKRSPFDVSDLRAIFSAPLYTGSMDDEAGYARPGPNVVRRGRFWVPIIALFSGMRLNEICQLTVDDFVEEDGVPIILIREDDDDETKRVKTEAGIRFVPVHPELERIGLLAFVEGRRADGPKVPLFPELSAGSTGYRSDPFSKFFARFRHKVGITDRKKVFHSFRHTYRDALREADISDQKVRALGGWSSSRTEENYGRGLKASTLARDIQSVKYDGLDLSHLYCAQLS